MIELRRNRAARQQGFTLIELMAVVVIIGLLAAIAIPTFLGQRDRANDAAAKSLVRDAQSAVEAAYTDTNAYAAITPAIVQAIEPSISFDATADDAGADQVALTTSATGFTVSSRSKSGTVFTLAKDTSATPPISRTCGTGCTW